MGKQVPYHNKSDHVIHIGPKSIRPGETRDVDEDHIPGPSSAEPEAPAAEDDPLADILEQRAPEVIDVLPSLSIEELDALERREADGKARKGVLEAIAEEKLSRAAQATESAEFAALLAEMDDDELAEQIDAVKEDAGKLALVEAEIERRAQG